MKIQRIFYLLVATLTAGCEKEPALPLDALPELQGAGGRADPRINGRVGTPDAPGAPIVSYVSPETATLVGQEMPSSTRGVSVARDTGDISLDFGDTDIREVAAQILGGLLQANYTIDPAVRGTVTLRTARPLTRAQLLPVLQALLAQNGAGLVQSGSLYRVIPAAAAATNVSPGGDGSGSTVVSLRYAVADELAKVIQPVISPGARIIADTGRNALIVSGEPEAREALATLVRSFDIDILAGQSYVLLMVPSGGVKDFASSLQDALRSQTGGALAGLVRVLPMERLNAVLIISAQRAYIDAARRLADIVDRARRRTVRSWHVHYLQNSTANDVANLLQQAFTPNNVTTQPNPRLGASPTARGGVGVGTNAGSSTGGSPGGGGLGGAAGGLRTGVAGMGSTSAGSLSGSGVADGAPTSTGQQQPSGASSNPLLGGLDVLGVGPGGTPAATENMRIIPNEQNNALLIYGTQAEEESIAAVLRKIDILPLQVRIDATIAEVTLNDRLQYGTQFFFKGGGLNAILNSSSLTNINPTAAALNATFPGFFLGGQVARGVDFAIQQLQAVTTVSVLSSPQLLVQDNQTARLQVGNLVPYLTQTSQSTIGAGAPVINSIAYQPTGVIMQVTPRVNSGGLVTLDIAQEVSDVDTGAATSGIDSPTFLARNVVSRVVVQGGQTIGLAGLIRDNASRGNQGIPWLKDIPVLGFLAGQQNNARTRTELIVLITPHVVRDQRDARALTQDLREQLINAALVPQELRATRNTGSPDPGIRTRRLLFPPP